MLTATLFDQDMVVLTNNKEANDLETPLLLEEETTDISSTDDQEHEDENDDDEDEECAWECSLFLCIGLVLGASFQYVWYESLVWLLVTVSSSGILTWNGAIRLIMVLLILKWITLNCVIVIFVERKQQRPSNWTLAAFVGMFVGMCTTALAVEVCNYFQQPETQS